MKIIFLIYKIREQKHQLRKRKIKILNTQLTTKISKSCSEPKKNPKVKQEVSDNSLKQNFVKGCIEASQEIDTFNIC